MSKAFTLTDKRVAISGAGGGIGKETALLVSQLGAHVMLSDLKAPAALADFIAETGGLATAMALDVTDRAAVESWANKCGDVDALVDCAAICPFDDWLDPDWDEVASRVFRTNLQGPLNLTRAFMEVMRKSNGGRIVLVGSIAGRVGGVRAAAHYAMSKGGIHSFVRWAAKKGAPDKILVNAVAPGPVATPMTQGEPFEEEKFPLGRIAQAHEIAGPLAFLVSPAASYISGAVLDVNGAQHFS